MTEDVIGYQFNILFLLAQEGNITDRSFDFSDFKLTLRKTLAVFRQMRRKFVWEHMNFPEIFKFISVHPVLGSFDDHWHSGNIFYWKKFIFHNSERLTMVLFINDHVKVFAMMWRTQL